MPVEAISGPRVAATGVSKTIGATTLLAPVDLVGRAGHLRRRPRPQRDRQDDPPADRRRDPGPTTGPRRSTTSRPTSATPGSAGRWRRSSGRPPPTVTSPWPTISPSSTRRGAATPAPAPTGSPRAWSGSPSATSPTASRTSCPRGRASCSGSRSSCSGPAPLLVLDEPEQRLDTDMRDLVARPARRPPRRRDHGRHRLARPTPHRDGGRHRPRPRRGPAVTSVRRPTSEGRLRPWARRRGPCRPRRGGHRRAPADPLRHLRHASSSPRPTASPSPGACSRTARPGGRCTAS